MPSPDTQKLADKIAKLLDGESQPPDTAALFAAIEKINHRLDKMEARALKPAVSLIEQQTIQHPSLEKFNIAEAIADEVFAGIQGMHKEKACQFEPGKPCDHCSMCNSRGF
ncbi:MAG TPA: hypothetical protein VGO43_11410 [Pyrinomonadaceae bacterium]|jgi:hypothetical protein|nr:hypothetical protein [Pyrinomonadaceae bacterium]